MIKNIVSKSANYFVGKSLDRQSILGVYAFIVLMVYSWTLFTSFYKLPSWMFYLTVTQILSIYAYAFSVNFAESLAALAALLILEYTFFLPLRKKDEFQARAMLVAFILLASSMWRLVLFQEYSEVEAFVKGEFIWWLITIAVTLPVAVFIPKIAKVRDLFRAFADRASIFLYIYIPLSLISILIVIVRNIS